MSNSHDGGLSPIEYHLLLALADGEQHGYALRDAIADESGGGVDPKAGTLYRVIARMLGHGFVRETQGPGDADVHPGRPRRYYALTEAGRIALADEARRLRATLLLADRRLRRSDG